MIYDETDRSSLIKACMADLRIDAEQYQPRAIVARISALKNNLTDAEQFAKTGARFGFDEAVARVYALYSEKLKESGGVDFDDLLMLTVRLFEGHPDVLAYYQDLFKHILIDEYQDTNHAQYRLIRLLTAKHKNLCVVGDDDQSIYRFRGADISNILNFEKDFPNVKVIKLEQNYRSTSNILGAAGAVVSRNLGRKKKDALDREAGRRKDPELQGNGREGRGPLHLQDHPAADRRRQEPARDRDPVPHQRPVARPGRCAPGPGHPVPDLRRPAVLRPQGDQGHHRLSAGAA